MLEALLRACSKNPDAVVATVDFVPASPLEELRLAFPSLDEMVEGKRIIDFGCGEGHQAIELAKLETQSVVGVDINPTLLNEARNRARAEGVGDRVEFRLPEELDPEHRGDLILSQHAMEHFSDPLAVLESMSTLLSDEGRAAITFSPPWLHPYGSHMHFFTPIPWVHLIFPERVVMNVRSRYRDDGATRYEEVEGGLNRMTLSRFESLVEESPFEFEWLRHTSVRDLPVVSNLPWIREFLTTRVDCLLRIPPC